MELKELTGAVIGCAIQVHRHLGPGLLESTYQACLEYELAAAGIAFRSQVRLPVTYRDVYLDCGYRIDFLVADQLIIEVKAVAHIEPIHTAQILTYLKLSGHRVGLLINFNVTLLKSGLHRLVVS